LHRNAEELYDLGKDPYEVTNLARSAGHQEVLKTLRADTMVFREKTNDFWVKNRMQDGEVGDGAVE
jgi:hypothetical protein